MKVCCQVQGEPVRRAKEGGNGFYGFKRFKGEGGGFAALLNDGILVSQPSLRVMLLS